MGGVGRRFYLTPFCYCGEKAIMRIARTAKNRGEFLVDVVFVFWFWKT